MSGNIRCRGSDSLRGRFPHRIAARSARHPDHEDHLDAIAPDLLHESASHLWRTKDGQCRFSSARHAVLRLPNLLQPALEADETTVVLMRDVECPPHAGQICEAFAEIQKLVHSCG